MRIRRGDVATVVGNQSSVANVAKLFGDDLEATYAADVFALVAGILVGFVVGQIPIPVPVVRTSTWSPAWHCSCPRSR